MREGWENVSVKINKGLSVGEGRYGLGDFGRLICLKLSGRRIGDPDLKCVKKGGE